jgi:catechol 2,3-dioxygenase-like lactoylglutathione lyase family enzyme
MASTDASSDSPMPAPDLPSVDLKLEVVTLPVADVDRAKRFYQGLGWRLDADIVRGDDFRVVQFTPPHSGCSIHFGKGLTASEPGAADRMILAVSDIDAARADLISRGADVSDVVDQRPPGSDADSGRSYFAYASFKDPDGNNWLLQEITTRLPGREWEGTGDIASLANLLRETAEHHGAFEAVAPPHDWWDWYAAYFDARQHGRSSEEASAAADRYMADVKNVVVPPASRP